MRNFVDAWQNLFDVNGKFLIGRLTFLEPNTSSNKLTIYDTDGNELDNPIYTSKYGLPKYQIMLQDRDYKVTFEMYIGQGNMESDENESSWLLYKTISSVNGNLSASQTTSTPTFLNTVAELKALNGMEDGATAIVQGYYTLGDSGDSRLYVWHANGNYTDDGGVTIKSNNSTSGAWIMTIPSDYIDVRWFGDIPDSSAKPTNQKSNLGQRVRAARAANMYDKNLYFPARQSTTSAASFYIFDGSNTVSVDQDIYCDSAVRFVVKEGTTGTAVTCNEFYKPSKHLFVAESQSQQIGGYTLTANWINTSWLNANDAYATNARIGYVIDQLKSPLVFTDTKIKVARDGINLSCTFNNCEMVECYKQITGTVTMQNMNIHTDWFADDYNYSNLTLLTPCTVKLDNCKDADTYILLKNKIQDYTYGDLGEQQLHNASIHGGCVLENCYGSATVTGNGGVELHNASLTLTGLTSNNSLNAIDSWLTIPANIVLQNIQYRRGSLAGSVTVQVLQNSYFENVDIYTSINCLGTDTTFSRCEIHGYVQGTNIVLRNNNCYSTIDQRDVNGVITVNCVGNLFYTTSQGVPARHYVHATTPESVVNGIWSHNGSSYDHVHWIRLDRTNLKFQDRDHHYTYAGNSEPYLMKWSGRNHPMQFYKYSGYRVDSSRGAGVFSTTTIPFLFFNLRTRIITAVNRQQYWKMFTVGRGFLMRSGHIGSNDLAFGIMEGDYRDYKCGDVAILWTWGSHTGTVQNELVAYASCTSLDGDGEAEYKVSFEAADYDHTQSEFSQGVEIGNYPSSEWGSSHPTEHWAVYPDTIYREKATLCVYIDPDFSTENTPQVVT